MPSISMEVPSELIKYNLKSGGFRWFHSRCRKEILHSYAFFVRFFLARARFQAASLPSNSSFETVNILRTALSMRSASVLPGTSGASNGFIIDIDL